MTKSKLFATVAAAAVATVALSGCQWNDHRGLGDAPANQLPKQAVNVVPMPDHFPNVAVVCYRGNGIYVSTHDKTDSQPTVVPNDPACQAGAR